MANASLQARYSHRIGIALFFGLVLLSSSAQAVAFNLGTMLCDFASQNGAWANFVNWIAYITGTGFVARAIYLARMWTEDPHRNPIYRSALYAFTGAGLLVFPTFASLLVRSVHGGGVAIGGVTACTPGVVAAAAGPTAGLDVLATNFVGNIREPAFFILGWTCYCLGAWFIYRGINKMSKYNTDPKAYSINAIIANMFFGAMLMWIGRAKNMLMGSIFGTVGGVNYATCNGLATAGAGQYVDSFGVTQTIYASGGSCGSAAGAGLIDWAGLGFTGPTGQFDAAYIAVTIFIQIVGFIAFIRGWLLAKTSVEGVGNATMGQAITHIIGGALCMNIIVFLRFAQNTFGVNFFT